MNRLARSDEKHNRAEESTPSDSDAFDYEALEAAVMQTRRGRWFLKEYLRRHQRDDTRRLLHAVQRLADISAQNTASAAAPDSPASATLESLRLLLADTANRLAKLSRAASGAEPAHPDIAAGRLAFLLENTAADMAAETITVLREAFSRMAGVLDEPRPHTITAAEADLCEDSSEDTEFDKETPKAASSPAIEAAALHPEGSASFAVFPAAPAAKGATGGKSRKRRIVIHRHSSSRQVNIPLPEQTKKDASKAEKETEKPKTRRAVVRLRNTRKERAG